MNKQHVAGSDRLPPGSGHCQESRVSQGDDQEEQALLRNDPDPTAAGSANPCCVRFIANDSHSCFWSRCALEVRRAGGAKWLWSPKTAGQLHLSFPCLVCERGA